MRPRKFVDTISFRISGNQRAAIEKTAQEEGLGIGEAARKLLDVGIENRAEAEGC